MKLFPNQSKILKGLSLAIALGLCTQSFAEPSKQQAGTPKKQYTKKAFNKEKVLSKVDQKALKTFIKEQNKKELARQERVARFLKDKKFPEQLKTRIVTYEQDSETLERTEYLVDVIDNKPIYATLDLDNALRTSKGVNLQPGGSLGLDLTGEGYSIGIMEGLLPMPEHIAFGGRVVKEEDAESHAHPTLVAGIMAGEKWDGHAFSHAALAQDATIRSWTWANHEAKIAQAVLDYGLLVSNHSWSGGIPAGHYYGKYYWASYYLDKVLNDAPYHTYVVSAGNNGGNAGSWDGIRSNSLSKNVITVGGHYMFDPALEEFEYSTYGSRGPVDDGRIKPDIAANALICGPVIDENSNNPEESFSCAKGTSLSTPMVSGAALVLQEHYYNQNSEYMRSATVRGLLLSTAREVGQFDGPDYISGWGAADFEKAANLVTNNGTSSIIQELDLSNTATETILVQANSTGELDISITWNDPAWGADSNTMKAGNFIHINNDRTPSLVNDLDLRVEHKGNTYYPWKLNPDNYEAAATKGDNIVDNIEKIDFDNVVAGGKYLITISHKNTLKDLASQNVSLIVSNGTLLTVNPCTYADWVSGGNYSINWQTNPATHPLVTHDSKEYKLLWGNGSEAPGASSQWEEQGPCTENNGNNQAPTASITNPTNNASLIRGVAATFNVQAADADGSVANVKFYEDGNLVGTDLSEESGSFSIQYTPTNSGTKTLSAIAEDNQGETTTSSTITVTVNEPTNVPPTVSFSAPTNNASFIQGNDILISTNSQDQDGSVSKVDFYDNSTLLASVTSSPFQYNWNSAALGIHNVTVIATDNQGATSTTASITIQVNAASNIKPTVNLTSPAEGSTFTSGTNITLSANASDADGTISKVEFFNGSASLGTIASSPYQMTWSNAGIGSHSITAVATDNSNESTTSTLVNLTVESTGTCEYSNWNATATYSSSWNSECGCAQGDKVLYNGRVYEAKWTCAAGLEPDSPNHWGCFEDLGLCQ